MDCMAIKLGVSAQTDDVNISIGLFVFEWFPRRTWTDNFASKCKSLWSKVGVSSYKNDGDDKRKHFERPFA
jgi:hypothetical protein